ASADDLDDEPRVASAVAQLARACFHGPPPDSHSAAPEALGQSPTAGSTPNKGSAPSIPTMGMVLRVPGRPNGRCQRVSADQGPIVVRLELPQSRRRAPAGIGSVG